MRLRVVKFSSMNLQLLPKSFKSTISNAVSNMRMSSRRRSSGDNGIGRACGIEAVKRECKDGIPTMLKSDVSVFPWYKGDMFRRSGCWHDDDEGMVFISLFAAVFAFYEFRLRWSKRKTSRRVRDAWWNPNSAHREVYRWLISDH